MENLFQRTQSTSATTSSSSPQSCSLQWKNLNKFIGEGVVSPTLLQRLTKSDVDLSKLTYKKQILFDISGEVRNGEMVALMGPSGSGKTTLLNVLGGRGLANLSGDVLMGGVKFKKSMKKSIAYVLQDDIFFTNLTVREQLYYTAVLRLPEYTPPPSTADTGNNQGSTNSAFSGIKSLCQSFVNTVTNSNKMGGSGVHSSNYYHKMKEVNTILKVLRMEKCADTPIFLISGGERKRCNIGTELLTSPKILLLDEPTSGLDSTAANALIVTLRQLASHGLTIVTSIHQPSSKVFYSFDKLLLLADGHVVYSGQPSKCLSYFATLNYFPPADYNPADFVMDLLTASSTAVSAENGGAGDDEVGGTGTGTGDATAISTGIKDKVMNEQQTAMEEGTLSGSSNSAQERKFNDHDADEESKMSPSPSSGNHHQIENDTVHSSSSSSPSPSHTNTPSLVGIEPSTAAATSTTGVPTEEAATNSYGYNYGYGSSYDYNSTNNIANNNYIMSVRDHLIQAWAIKEEKERKEQQQQQQQMEEQKIDSSNAITIKEREGGLNLPSYKLGENSVNKSKIDDDNNKNENSLLQRFQRNSKSFTSSFFGRTENSIATTINDKATTAKAVTTTLPTTGTTEEEPEYKYKYPTRYATQFFILLERALKNAKSESMTGLHFMETIGITLICGFIWFQLPYNEDQINNRAGYIFFFQSYWFIMSLFQGMMQFLPERIILLKERSAGSYHLSAYFLSKTISGLPIRLLLPFLFLAISYPMVDLNPSVQVFFAVVGTQLLATLCGESVGVFLGTLSTDFQKCLTMATLASMLLMLTGGFYAQKLPIFMFWLTYVSPFKYSYDACIFLVFSTPLPCVNGYTLPSCIYSPDFTATTDDVANYLGATQSVGLNVGLLFIFMLAFRLFAYLSLRYIPHNNGRK